MPINMQYIWDCGVFERTETVFASGKPANNKFDFEKLEHVTRRRHRLVSELGMLVVKEANCLISVGDGAHFWTRDIGEMLGLAVAYTDKIDSTPGQKDFIWSDEASRHIAAKVQKSDGVSVVVDDATTEYTSFDGIDRLEEVNPMNTLYISILHRGPLAIIRERHKALVYKHIPNVLPEDSEYWQYAVNL